MDRDRKLASDESLRSHPAPPRPAKAAPNQRPAHVPVPPLLWVACSDSATPRSRFHVGNSPVVVMRQPSLCLMHQASLVLALLGLCLAPTTARALPTFASPEVIHGFAGVVKGKLDASNSRAPGSDTPSAVTISYDNTASPSNFGLSSTDLAAEWGDRTVLTGTGLLSSHKITLFNSAANGGGPLLTAEVAVDFYDGATNTFIGGYIAHADFGAGMGTGFYAIVNVSDLEPSQIVLPVDVLVVQRVISHTGTANRLGIASLDPVTVGSSPSSMHIFASTIGGGIPGYYLVMSGNANPGYQFGLAQQPAGTASRTWGQLKRLYR